MGERKNNSAPVPDGLLIVLAKAVREMLISSNKDRGRSGFISTIQRLCWLESQSTAIIQRFLREAVVPFGVRSHVLSDDSAGVTSMGQMVYFS
jgi:hypothetical protein